MTNTKLQGYIMALMAKAQRGRRPKHPPSKGAAKGRSGQYLNLVIDPDLAKTLEAFIAAQKFKTTKTDVVEVALQELFKSAGMWPPKPESAT